PKVPANAVHNGHIFYLMPPKPEQQQPLLKSLAGEQISATSHYVPLHNSPAGLKYSRAHGDLPVTVRVGSSIVRLPVFAG
ncbi:DegT/DnrJ/EryC1/StrS family aminotransferase, partial [Streptomyces scabiei]|uniref:DegT/DnrJ/EryC1/StrS family aminotransferase n=1 Tax=Streptomyces scabiei TaxID=1930 RepID=UPI0038F779AD